MDLEWGIKVYVLCCCLRFLQAKHFSVIIPICLLLTAKLISFIVAGAVKLILMYQ